MKSLKDEHENIILLPNRKNKSKTASLRIKHSAGYKI